MAAKTYTDWPDKAKHSIPYATHQKHVAAQPSKPASTSKLPDAARVTARAKKDPKFLARALKNPGLRSRITDPNLLPSTNPRAYVIPGSGSTLTNQQLADRAKADVNASYAISEGQNAATLKAAQQHQTDVGEWWDQYQAAVNDAAGRIGQSQDQLVSGAQGVAQGIQGLGQAQVGGILNQAAAASGQRAVPGSAPSASLATEANQAQVSRETLAASALSQAQQQAAASKGFAGYQAGVVAPAYKLLAANETQRKIDAARTTQGTLAVKKSAELLKTRADIRQQELANTVALQGLGIKQAAAETAAAAASPAGAAAKTAATEEAKQAAKLGLSVHQYRLLGPDERARRLAKKSTTQPGSDVITSGPLAGKTKTWVAAHPGAAGKLVDDYNAGKKKKPKPGQGPDWVPQTQMGAAASQVVTLKGFAQKAKQGLLFKPPKGGQKTPGIKLGRQGAKQKLIDTFGTEIKDPILLSAVLDAVYDGHLSPVTVRGLVGAHYKPGTIARSLGVPTAGQLPKPTGATVYTKGPGRPD